jgi:hypothetical protein
VSGSFAIFSPGYVIDILEYKCKLIHPIYDYLYYVSWYFITSLECHRLVIHERSLEG